MARSNDSNPGSVEPVSPEELDQWQAEKGMGDCERCLFLDGDSETAMGDTVWNNFKNAILQNGISDQVTNGIPMVIDETMTIRAISGTYEWSTYPLDTILQLLND